MATEVGEKMQRCIDAVCHMHSSVSRLLTDFDKCVSWPSISVFANQATRDLTCAVRANFWMPEGVFRYLSCKTNPKLVEAITVSFVKRQAIEPMLLVGSLEYVEDPLQVKSTCEAWDLWNIYFHWDTGWVDREPKVFEVPHEKPTRIRTAKVVSAPLYSLSSMKDFAGILQSVR